MASDFRKIVHKAPQMRNDVSTEPCDVSDNRWTVQEVIDAAKNVGLKSTKQLKAHQVEGLCFLLKQESDNRGAILAHDMGLGKTLQSLLLITIRKKYMNQTGTTLITCPLAASDNWVMEIKSCFDPIPSVLQFKGKEKDKDLWISHRQSGKCIEKQVIEPEQITHKLISKYDIVLTHYHALTTIWGDKVIDPIKSLLNMQKEKTDDWSLDRQDKVSMLQESFPDFVWPDEKMRLDAKILDIEIIPERASKRLGAALSFRYKRVIIDEGHNMRNPKTQLATMMYAISAEYRIALTGTPKINYSEDIWSLFHFIRVPGLCGLKEFKTKSLKIRELEKKNSQEIEKYGQKFFESMQKWRGNDATMQAKNYVENLYTRYMHRITKQEISQRDTSTDITDPVVIIDGMSLKDISFSQN
jgi:SNF2 family DNA or RNA helicase